MKKLLIVVGVMLALSSPAWAQYEQGRDQCRGSNDPGTVTFPTAFTTTPTVTCTPATWLHEVCNVLSTSTTQFTFECVTSGGAHNAGPMTWGAQD